MAVHPCPLRFHCVGRKKELIALQIQPTAEGILLTEITNFDLETTLDCGQCFRFARNEDGGWHGVAGHRPLTISQTNQGILLKHVTEEDFESFWRVYFDLDRDYAAVQRTFPAHPRLQPCLEFAAGMRILRQDPLEALVGFIISQNNNVPRIKGIVRRLCESFGEPIGEEYAFPTPQRLAALSAEDLAPLRSGWRAAYILDAARKVACGDLDLDQVAQMPIVEARKALQTIHGVGPKVAECVLLYGMGRLEAFPLDVWMKRAMTDLFPDLTPEDFGQYAGIAQQYIFHYCRSNCCRSNL